MRASGTALAGALLCAVPAQAQLFDKSEFFRSGLSSDTLNGAAPYGSPIPDNRVYIHGFFDQLEGRIGNGQYLRWDGQAWIGNDYNKLWIKSEGRYNPGNRGHYALRTNASYDLYLTQRLVLQPQFETNWYTKEDRGRGVGAGLSDIDTGLRLRYDVTRKVSPYVGVAYQRWFGGTSSLRREEGSKVNDVRFLVGLKTWF